MEKYINRMNEYKLIEAGEEDIIRFGLKNGINILWVYALIIMQSVFLDIFLQGCLFLLLFSLLRTYAGGFHAKTRTRCFILSVTAIAMCLINIKLKIIPDSILNITFLLSAAVIFHFAPVADLKRGLDGKEKEIYRRLALIILGICCLLYVAFHVLFISRMLYTLLHVVSLEGIVVAVGVLKLRYQQKKELMAQSCLDLEEAYGK